MQQRLFEITYLLTEHGSMTAGQLAERFGVSRRTIYRDVDALSAAGIPVYTEKGKGGGIRLLPDFVLDKTLFTEEERRQLVTQMDSLAGIDMPGSQALSDKLAALFGRREDAWLEVDFMPWAGGDDARALFNLLRDSILARHPVAFGYTGLRGETEQRVAEPVKLVFRGQGWYLQAWCRLRQDFRVFKFTRMRQVRALDETFPPRAAPSLKGDMPTPAAPPTEILLRFSPRCSFRVYDELPAESIRPQPDGSLLVTCTFSMGEWLVGYLLSFGEDVEVLAPAGQRENIKKILENSLQKYK